MLSFILIILFWVGIFFLKRHFINNKHEEFLFALEMGINIVLVIWLNIIGLIIVAFFEYKHAKRAIDTKDIKNFIYGRC